MRQEYLGDGAYVTIDRDFEGQIILTANHHNPELATDVIHLEPSAVDLLAKLINKSRPKREIDYGPNEV